MKQLLAFIFIALLCGILWALPLYICGNLLLWLFHINFHLTLFQSIGVMLLLSAIQHTLVEDKENK